MPEQDEAPMIVYAKKIGLGVVGFLICAAVATFSRILIDIVFVALGITGGSYGASLILAIGPAFMMYEQLTDHHVRIGGRVALGVWTGSIILGVIWSLVA